MDSLVKGILASWHLKARGEKIGKAGKTTLFLVFEFSEAKM